MSGQEIFRTEAGDLTEIWHRKSSQGPPPGNDVH
jgi:hypothetical protein